MKDINQELDDIAAVVFSVRISGDDNDIAELSP